MNRELHMQQEYGPPPLFDEDKEINNGFKDTVIYTSSMAMKGDKKRERFYNRLKNSKYLNKYVDRKGMGLLNNYLNDDGKAAIVYSMAYIQTYNEKDLNKYIFLIYIYKHVNGQHVQ